MTERASIETEEFISPRVRERALAPVYWNFVLQTSNAVEEIYGKTLSIEYNVFADGRMKMIIPKREWNEIGEYIAERLINKKGYFENIEEKTESAKQEILSFLVEIKEKDLSKLSFQHLVNLADKIYTLFIKYDAASVFAWFVAGDALKQKVGVRLKLSGDDLDIIALPDERTFITQMERDVVEASLKDGPAEKIANTLAEKYYWIPFDYDSPIIWDATYFAHRIDEYRKHSGEAKAKRDEMLRRDSELRREQKEILEKRDFDVEEKRLIHILRSNAVWTDERKMLDFQLFFHYNRVLLEFEKRYDVPLTHLKYLFTHELVRLQNDSAQLKLVANQRIAREFMTISEHGNICIATETELKKIRETLDRQPRNGDIRGTVACRGTKTKYIARVKVLRSSKECPKVEHGEILVATMTTPDYVPAMDRAIGFITDEGGVTCHAAIVAREMNKFCIIGTKIATQVLKDGDLVEVDANTGVVRRL